MRNVERWRDGEMEEWRDGEVEERWRRGGEKERKGGRTNRFEPHTFLVCCEPVLVTRFT